MVLANHKADLNRMRTSQIEMLENSGNNGENVLSFGNYEVMEVFSSFLSMHGKNSKRTEEEYRNRVIEFFEMTLNKEIKFVTLDDIKTIKKKDVQTKYIDELTKRGNTNNTIQVKLNSVRSFYNDMLSNDLNVNPMIFKVKLVKDVKHHEALTIEEVQQLFEFMKNEKELAMEKYLLVKMLFTTANRKTATTGSITQDGMTWEDNFITKKDAETGKDIHVVRVKDKGGIWIEKPISDEFYEELQQINNGQKYVFEINPKTISRALDRFSKMIGKKITPHSLKASAITIGYQMCRDINLAKQLGGHASIKTTEIYLRDEKSLTNQLSYSMNFEIDDNILNELSHKDLLEFIKSNEDIHRLIAIRLQNNY